MNKIEGENVKNGTLKNKYEGNYDIEGWASVIVRNTNEGNYVTQLFGSTSHYGRNRQELPICPLQRTCSGEMAKVAKIRHFVFVVFVATFAFRSDIEGNR
jgi:hypothetical protein